jgi:hypothetical protein
MKDSKKELWTASSIQCSAKRTSKTASKQVSLFIARMFKLYSGSDFDGDKMVIVVVVVVLVVVVVIATAALATEGVAVVMVVK